MYSQGDNTNMHQTALDDLHEELSAAQYVIDVLNALSEGERAFKDSAMAEAFDFKSLLIRDYDEGFGEFSRDFLEQSDTKEPDFDDLRDYYNMNSSMNLILARINALSELYKVMMQCAHTEASPHLQKFTIECERDNIFERLKTIIKSDLRNFQMNFIENEQIDKKPEEPQYINIEADNEDNDFWEGMIAAQKNIGDPQIEQEPLSSTEIAFILPERIRMALFVTREELEFRAGRYFFDTNAHDHTTFVGVKEYLTDIIKLTEKVTDLFSRKTISTKPETMYEHSGFKPPRPC